MPSPRMSLTRLARASLRKPGEHVALAFEGPQDTKCARQGSLPKRPIGKVLRKEPRGQA